MVSRITTAFNPPVTDKNSGAIKFGILGAAKIASVLTRPWRMV